MKAYPYDPPRAGSWSRTLARMSRLRNRLGHLHPSLEFPASSVESRAVLLAWLLVPGLMWHQHGRKLLGAGAMAIWAVFMAVHIVVLDPAAANLAAMLAGAIHAISAAAAMALIFPHWQGLSRIWRTSLFTSLLIVLVYSFGMRQMVAPFAQRVVIHNTPAMIHTSPWLRQEPWNRGEWVAYRLNNGATYVGQILACPGDAVQFHPGSLEVNGISYARTSVHLPTNGELQMDRAIYLVLPAEFTFKGDVTEALLALMYVEEDHLVGRPWRHWLGAPSHLDDLKPLGPTIASQSPTP